LLLSGCEELFEYNAFGDFDQPMIPQSADDVAAIVEENTGDNAGLLDAISDIAGSDDFYASLAEMDDAESAALIDSITGALSDIYSDLDAPLEERQEAALLTADVILNSNPEAKAAVDSLVDTVIGALDGTTELETIDDAVVSILETAFEGVENVELALDALAGASDAFSVFGVAIPDDIALLTTRVVRVATLRADVQVYDIDDYAGIAGDALVAMALASFQKHYEKPVADGGMGIPLTTKQQILDVAQNLDDPVNNAIVQAVVDELLAADSPFRRMWNAAGMHVLIELPVV
jgi:hypothetical protein